MAADFEQLYITYYMQVYSFLMTLAKNQDVSEEVAQKTFFKAMTTGGRYRGDASEFTWLCAIVKNLLADKFRQQKKAAPLPPDEMAGRNVEKTLDDEDAAFQIHRVLLDLENRIRKYFS